MSLSDIMNGAEDTSAVNPGPPEEDVASAKDAKVSAVGRAFRMYDDRFASLRVYDISRADYVPTHTFDGRPTDGDIVDVDYMLLQSFSEVYVERTGPTYSFGSALVYTSGSDAKQFVYSAVILADKLSGDNPARFARAYENAMRASKLVEKAQPRYIELRYRDQIRRGYLTSFSSQISSAMPNRVDITFSMFVTTSASIEVSNNVQQG